MTRFFSVKNVVTGGKLLLVSFVSMLVLIIPVAVGFAFAVNWFTVLLYVLANLFVGGFFATKLWGWK